MAKITKAKKKKLRRHILRLIEKETDIGEHIKEHIDWCISDGGSSQFFRNPRKFLYEVVVVAFACAIEGGYFILRKTDD